MLAWAYLASGLVGLLAYGFMMRRALIEVVGVDTVTEFPFRQMLSFGLPLVSSDVLQALRATLVIVILEYLRTIEDVASFRAVVPVAQLNLAVMQSFKFLFLPTSSRLWAAKQKDAALDLYWHSAAWLAVGTFPIFITTFALARPLTTLLFGDSYSSSALLLAVLSLGYYINSAFGLNTQTVKAMGMVRAVGFIDGLTAAVAIGLNIWLISTWGAVGAAVSTATLFVLQNLFIHYTLAKAVGGLPMPTVYRGTYLSILFTTAAVMALQVVLGPPLAASICLVVIGCGTVFVVAKNSLDIGSTFPELARIPLVGRWLG
jgi:O-antigen/teichoic acid export membrane protein